ncbi:hypothetical protein [Microbispora sp. NPDC046933]|uniref:hypothetical protein n=1 Tax=Microbispora sp. NPDC046933 TaxID=3155618 RepID=UPI0033EA65AE
MGGLLIVAVVAGTAVYLSALGLDEADKMASVIGALAAIAGIGLTLHGMLQARRAAPDSTIRSPGVQNVISGGSQHGSVLQARDIRGTVRFGASGGSTPESRESDL